MANTDTPFGFKPVGHLLGLDWNQCVHRYNVASDYATALLLHDLVTLAGSADADGVPTVQRAAATDTAILGSIVFIEPNKSDLTKLYIPASTGGYVYVTDDPYVIYEAQEDDVDGSALAAADVSLGCDILVTAGSTVTGVSGMEIDRSTKSANAAINLKLLRLAQKAGNEFGDYAKWWVLINEHMFKAATIGLA